MEVSEILKEARTKKGMTQQELADCVYVTRQTISKWELGKSVPDEASLRLLYKCLDIDNNDKKEIKKLATDRQTIFMPLPKVWSSSMRSAEEPAHTTAYPSPGALQSICTMISNAARSLPHTIMNLPSLPAVAGE